ncbi:hypothetical protein MasN3_34120 [Massilia varians]|uniref:Uncharacterized protein n=1 Tax=Massilia varians TaxID=457921 RepID=A0ABN6TEY3_9BURK|nr:hypothetical protein MasN3_34120 [Massilia varians]
MLSASATRSPDRHRLRPAWEPPAQPFAFSSFDDRVQLAAMPGADTRLTSEKLPRFLSWRAPIELASSQSPVRLAASISRVSSLPLQVDVKVTPW